MVNLKVSTDKPLMADAVRVILSTILFHRMLGPINAKTTEVLGVTYSVPDSSELEKQLSDRLTSLNNSLNLSKNVVITLRFFEPASKKAWFHWSGEACWEEWVIRCQLDGGDLGTIQRDLRETMLKIIQVMDLKKEHIPPVTTKEMVSFPYDIRVS